MTATNIMLALIFTTSEYATVNLHTVGNEQLVVMCVPAGDHALTALAIGGMLGIAGNGLVFTGPEIDGIDDGALRAIVLSCNVYARASPENKLRIVRALQVRAGSRAAPSFCCVAKELPCIDHVCAKLCTARLWLPDVMTCGGALALAGAEEDSGHDRRWRE
jgi:hypothetical protein